MSPGRTALSSLVFVVLCASILVASAETYKDIGPLDTLADLKSRFPGANFQRLAPAWARAGDAVFSISGSGMSGTIVVKLTDTRVMWHEWAAQESDPALKEKFKEFANQPSDVALSVDWVRWLPTNPIPLARFVAKYGRPESTGFADEDLSPYRRWMRRGLTTYLSDDEVNVLRVDFEFTAEEFRKAYRSKNREIPPWLRESANEPNGGRNLKTDKATPKGSAPTLEEKGRGPKQH